ncbi:diacylglycerol kinase [Parasutterella muris]|uniref:Diacylglycerol kinase n=2 Tax=Parasutterella TaxID=577310 RepID=A0A6L6YG26_9BURK|nr:diacylglycerol kinase [Parasutterella muris]MVX56630.1 diacylglycerol kinase [Parasutterella muris]
MIKPQPKDASELKGKTGLRRLINATRYSAQGFKAAWKTEDAFRQESVLAVILIPVAVLLPVSLVYKLLLIGSVILVLIVEVLNSAIEAVVDRFGGEIHPLSGKAKDLGSAAVLLALTLALITWVSILADAFL